MEVEQARDAYHALGDKGGTHPTWTLCLDETGDFAYVAELLSREAWSQRAVTEGEKAKEALVPAAGGGRGEGTGYGLGKNPTRGRPLVCVTSAKSFQ